VGASSQPRRDVWRVGDLVIDEGQQLVRRGDEVIELPKLSFDLLLALVRSAPDVVSIDSLLTRVWPGVVVSPETVVQRVKMLREALDDRAAEPRYIVSLRLRGYRLVAAVSKTEAPDAFRITPSAALEPKDPPPQLAAAAGPEASRRNRRRFAILAAAALALVVALGLWAVQRGTMSQSPAPGTNDPALRTVAVLPFKNLSADSADAAIALGVPDIVLDRLTSVEGLTVVARDSAFRAGEVSSDPAEISQRLRAVFLVEGTVQRSGTMLRVSARLVDARAGQTLWSTHYDRPIEELFAMQDDIATQVTTALNDRIAGVRAPEAASVPTRDIEAYLAWLRGRTLTGRYTATKADAAATEFQQAIALDPNFAVAYAALYDARMQAAAIRFDDTDAARRRYRPLLERALALDPDSGAVLFAQAMWDDLDNAKREAIFREAARREPGNSRGLISFAAFLHVISDWETPAKVRGSGLFTHYLTQYQNPRMPKPLADARHAEAMRLLERAVEIDPLAAPARFHMIDYAEPDRETAETQLEALLAIDPDSYPALQRLARYRWLFHDSPSQGIALIERAIAADPENPFARQTAATLYLDIDDSAAAADVAAATPFSLAAATPGLALHAGDWRTAGIAAQRHESFVFDIFESWGNAEALRDMALQTRDYASIEDLLCLRYYMSKDGKVDVHLGNFRSLPLLAHLQLAQGNTARANRVLNAVIAWVDADDKYGPVKNLRTRAQALMLLGRREEALKDLAAGFAVDRDHTEWWYTIERDPVYDEVRETAEFRALAADAQRFAARERAAVEELRRQGKIPYRPATQHPAVAGGS
jgi:TolB-like protein/DNA-binding winged helix-turn-helix (wHTH) protein/tetratricopeptide (TPR) repeat protein